MPKEVFDVIPEDPQVKHVPTQVQPIAVEEQGRQEGGVERDRRGRHCVDASSDFEWDRSETRSKCIETCRPQELGIDEHTDVGEHDRAHEKGDSTGRVFVSNRQEHGVLGASLVGPSWQELDAANGQAVSCPVSERSFDKHNKATGFGRHVSADVLHPDGHFVGSGRQGGP